MKRMHNATAPKQNKTIISGLDILLHSGSGHIQPCCRGGAHSDKRLRRQRTRSAKLQAALRD